MIPKTKGAMKVQTMPPLKHEAWPDYKPIKDSNNTHIHAWESK